MDDIIRIIVFIFFVWSIIGSLFSNKNKKKDTPQRKYRRNYSGKEYQSLPSSSKTPEDILGEIFGNKLPNSMDYDNKPNNVELENENLEKNEKSITQWNIDYDKLSSLEEDERILKKEIEKDFNSTTITQLSSKNIVKEKIKNKNSLKDAIIISEILNKPKALRH